MQAPSPEKISELKAKFPERSLHLVEVDICGETHSLVMTGPSTDEHKKYTDEATKGLEIKDPSDKAAALRGTVLNAVLAQTRWPERDDVKRIFEYAPEALDAFYATLSEHAGANAEVRSKKL